MKAHLIDMIALSPGDQFSTQELDGFLGEGRVHFIGKAEKMGAEGELLSQADSDSIENFVQVRGVGSGATPWLFVRQLETFRIDADKVEIRYQVADNGKVYITSHKPGEIYIGRQ